MNRTMQTSHQGACIDAPVEPQIAQLQQKIGSNHCSCQTLNATKDTKAIYDERVSVGVLVSKMYCESKIGRFSAEEGSADMTIFRKFNNTKKHVVLLLTKFVVGPKTCHLVRLFGEVVQVFI